MDELKPCPFCGRKPIVDDCGDYVYFVRCECGIAQDKLYAQKCDAVRRWNTRKTGEIARDICVLSNDCISRQAAVDDIRTMVPKDAQLDIKWIEMWLKQLPAAQPQRMRGYERVVYCGECAHMMPDGRCREFTDDNIRPSASDYCSAGEKRADMRGGEQESEIHSDI